MFKKINNMKVQPRLTFCFIIVVIMASISGILGTALLMKTDGDYSKALVQNGFSQGKIGTFNTYLNKGGAVVRDVVLLSDEADITASTQELTQIKEKTAQAFKEIKTYSKTPKELEYIETIEEKLPQYYSLEDQVISLGMDNKNDEALDLFRTQARPVLNEVMTAAEALADLNTELGNSVSTSLSLQSRITAIANILIIIAAFLISFRFAIYIAKSFSKPILQVKEASQRLADGKLDIQLDVETTDEIGDMARSFVTAAAMIQGYIGEISKALEEFSNGNFNINTTMRFKGDFLKIEDAINTIANSLSETLHQINEASSQVAMGSTQLSESAQSLAEGATDQAGAVEELTATIENVASLVEENADNANEAYKQAKGFETEAENSSQEMELLTQAMERINETSKEIENIISEIEDIASQTNLLSLNASIEAARAGEAGRGFAVVAGQIGKLAADSAKSAVNTRGLIVTAIQEVESGNQISNRTSEALKKVIDGIKLLAQASKETSTMSTSQAEAMKQIQLGVEQISEVVQSNSAAAQETSATSEELSAQSENLNELVEQFQLKK